MPYMRTTLSPAIALSDDRIRTLTSGNGPEAVAPQSASCDEPGSCSEPPTAG